MFKNLAEKAKAKLEEQVKKLEDKKAANKDNNDETKGDSAGETTKQDDTTKNDNVTDGTTTNDNDNDKQTNDDNTQSEIQKKLENSDDDKDDEDPDIWGDTTHRYLFMTEEEGATKQQKTLAVCVILTQFFIYLAIWISAEIQNGAYNRLETKDQFDSYGDLVCGDTIFYIDSGKCNNINGENIFLGETSFPYKVQPRIEAGKCPYPGEIWIGVGLALLLFLIFVAPDCYYGILTLHRNPKIGIVLVLQAFVALIAAVRTTTIAGKIDDSEVDKSCPSIATFFGLFIGVSVVHDLDDQMYAATHHLTPKGRKVFIIVYTVCCITLPVVFGYFTIIAPSPGWFGN